MLKGHLHSGSRKVELEEISIIGRNLEKHAEKGGQVQRA